MHTLNIYNWSSKIQLIILINVRRVICTIRAPLWQPPNRQTACHLTISITGLFLWKTRLKMSIAMICKSYLQFIDLSVVEVCKLQIILVYQYIYKISWSITFCAKCSCPPWLTCEAGSIFYMACFFFTV